MLAHLPQVGPRRGGDRASHRRPAACGSSRTARWCADLPVTPLTDGAPVYDRPTQRPAELDALQAFDPLSLPAPKDLGEALLALLARPTIASKEWVFAQYDHMVRLGGVVLPGHGGRGGGAGRADRTRASRSGGRLQRALRVPRPVRGRAAGGGGVRAQRLLRGRRAARADRLPELRQPRAAGDHVAVRRGDSRASPRPAASSDVPVVIGQREPLQRDRRQGDPAHADRGGGGAAARRDARPAARRSARRGRPDRGARRDARRSSAAPSGCARSTGKIAGRPPVLDASARAALQPVVRELVRSRTVASRARLQRGRAGGGARRVLHGGRGEAGRGAGHARRSARWRRTRTCSARTPRGSSSPTRPSGRRRSRRRARRRACRSRASGRWAGIGLVISGLVDLRVSRLSDAWRRGIPSLMKKPTHL